MADLSYTEENYLKAIFHLSEHGNEMVSTNDIAEIMETRAASVTDMVKKLASKGTLRHQRYKGIEMTAEGKKVALQVVRKHRLWEVFLVDKLKFNWDEVHEVAEQLEHIKSPLLIERLDSFLGNPQYDPHGDPIPDANGVFELKPRIPLSDMDTGDEGTVIGVSDSSSEYLKYLDKIGAYIGAELKVIEKVQYDSSLEIVIDDQESIFISNKSSKNLLIASK